MIDRTNLARRAYTTGGLGFVFIGGLHTTVHLLDLAGPELEERFRTFGTIDVSGQAVMSWDLFQGISLLMGLFSIAVGLVDLGAIRQTKPDALPPISVALANMAMLAAIVVIGATYLGPLQVYGGLFGIVCFGIGPVVAATGHRFAPPMAAR